MKRMIRRNVMAARTGKMHQVYVSQEYVPDYGWEDVTVYDDTSSESLRLAKQDVKDYRDNGYGARVVTRRISNPDYTEPENSISYDDAVAWVKNECPYEYEEAYISYGNKNYMLKNNGNTFAQVYVYEDGSVEVRNAIKNRTRRVYSIDELAKEVERIANQAQ